eukprot:3553193-Amphidinium_carterae.1
MKKTFRPLHAPPGPRPDAANTTRSTVNTKAQYYSPYMQPSTPKLSAFLAPRLCYNMRASTETASREEIPKPSQSRAILSVRICDFLMDCH